MDRPRHADREFRGAARPRPVPGGPADLLLVNAHAITMDSRQPQAEAVAVAKGQILGVGSRSEAERHASSSTVVHDLAGGTLLPGFHDSHNHMLPTAYNATLVDLSSARTIADVLRLMAERAERTPPGEWVLSSGRWHETQLEEKRFPRREEIDAALPRHPVMIQRGGHNVVVNSAAFALAGVPEDVTNPDGGTFVRNPATGALTGHLIDAAMGPVRSKVPRPSQAELESALLALQKRYHAAGMTSVLEPGLEPHEMAAYRALRQRQELQVRVTMMWRLRPGFDAASLESTLEAVRSGVVTLDADDAYLRTTGLKVGMDGGVEAGYYREPYAHPDDPANPRGLPLVSAENFSAICSLAAESGWQVGTHCVGDAGIDRVLDGYEQANQRSPITGLRWTLIHMMYAREDHWERANRLGLVVTAQQPLQYTLADGFRHYIGAERARDIEPLRMYLDRSTQPVGGGSDSPVTPFQPLIGIWSSVTRATDRAGIQGPEWAISPEEALRMYTVGSAWCAFEEHTKGSITPGKFADFVVLDHDPRQVEPDAIRELQVLRTYVGGNLVYEADSVGARATVR
ncbi:MAG: amidohydrolase [Chloroflexi bacterium]|nr:amidohydrolase [Chloroflexota bacterium]